jgi:hypothetical protein
VEAKATSDSAGKGVWIGEPLQSGSGLDWLRQLPRKLPGKPGGFLRTFVGKAGQVLSREVIASAVLAGGYCVRVSRVVMEFRCLGM